MSRIRMVLYALPFCIVLVLCAKNYWYFGSFGVSSWTMMSAYKTCLWNLPQAERDSLYKAGTISYFSTQEPYGRIWRYGVPAETSWEDRVRFYPRTPKRQVPILDQGEFLENGSNLNHWFYLKICEAQSADVKWALLNHPMVFVRTFLMSVELSFRQGYQWFTYRGHLGRRRANLDKLAVYLPWIAGNEWSTTIDGGNIRYDK